MSLKTDYKDDIYEGSRRYRITPNEDGTSTITDATTYTQKGDKFGQNDMNAITTEINKMQRTIVVTLPAAGWSAAAPYSQRVAVPGILATDNPELHPYTPKDITADELKQRQKFTGMITDGDTEDGYATFYCGAKKPTVDFPVLLKGVSASE